MQGKRIVVTRALHQAEELSYLLTRRGAQVLHYPCIAIVPPEDTRQLDSAVREMAAGAFDWLILTSANAAMILSERLAAAKLIPPSNLALACVGPATAEAAKRLLGMQAWAIPEQYVAEALIALIKPALPARILVLQAEKARPVLREGLAAAGATITTRVAYRTIQGHGGVQLSTLLKARQVDAITFTSASTVENCIRRLQTEETDLSLLAHVCLACIGPITAQAMLTAGLDVGVMPARHTIEDLVDGLEIYFRSLAKGHSLYV